MANLIKFSQNLPKTSKIPNPIQGMTPVTISKSIDMAPFGAAPSGREQYSLCGVVHFDGSSCRGGHYTAAIRSAENKWFLANDENVFFDKKATASAAIEDPNAYLLFFERERRDLNQKSLAMAVLRYY